MNWSDRGGLSRFLGLLLACTAIVGPLAYPPRGIAEEAGKEEASSSEEKKDDKKDKEKDGKDKKEKEKKEADLTQLIPIPVGHGGGGIKVPQHDEHGRLQMMFEIGTAFREDELHLRMENLKIETFDVGGKPDMIIEMPKSMLNLKTHVLTSVDPVLIKRTDFEITGGNASFNTKLRFGTFKGPVKMLIFDRSY